MMGEDFVLFEVEERLFLVVWEVGLWGLDVLEEFGGLNLSMLFKCLVIEELYKTIMLFIFLFDVSNLYMLM